MGALFQDRLADFDFENEVNRSPVRMKRILGSHLLWVVVIDCDYE
jgi:hypothetical protein